MVCTVQPLVVRKDVSFDPLQEVVATFSSGQPLAQCRQIVASGIRENAKFFVL